MIRLLAFVLALIISAPVVLADNSRPLAMNLAPVNDWSAQQPFIDVMKTARRWIGHKSGQWGGVTFAELEARGILDDQGWPTEIPHDLASIGTLILTDLPENAQVYAGRYVLRFDGKGIVEVGGAVRNVRYGKNQVAFDFVPGGMVILKLQRTDPARTGDYVRNITVVKETHEKAFQRGEIFNPDWLPYVEGFKVLRFMDWMVTNDSDQREWARRPKVDDFTYGRYGIPAEVMIRLANRLNAAPWFCMPHLADDEYQRRFADLVRARLDPDLPVYVEYSNEVWNWQFLQTEWTEARALERWGQQYKGQDYYGMKTAQMAQIWIGAFAGERNRLNTVLATQTGWLGLEKAMLEAELWVAEDPANPPPHSVIDAYAVTGYFGFFIGTDEHNAMVKSWLRDSLARAEAQAGDQGLTGEARQAFVHKHRFDLATDLAIEELEHAAIAGEEADSLDRLLNEFWPYHAAVAERYGLDMIVYEGGTHVVGIGAQVGDDELTEFLIHLNYSHGMARLYDRLLAAWFDVSDAPFSLFSDVMTPTKWGSWGHLRFLGDDNPRWQAVQRFR